MLAEDEKLGAILLSSEKDRAEHIMLVDLARNDVNRVCQPKTVKVDHLMKLEKFSHVIHLTSQVSGILREDKNRFDAFRSIFPAGTVSGAPKIKAIEIISSLEKEKRGVYAGAVGRFDFAKDEMDTCIAIRTMVFKDGAAYLQAGGGIVFDSVEEDEFIETVNKLGGNVRAVEAAERKSGFPFFRIIADHYPQKVTGTQCKTMSPRPQLRNNCITIDNIRIYRVLCTMRHA